MLGYQPHNATYISLHAKTVKKMFRKYINHNQGRNFNYNHSYKIAINIATLRKFMNNRKQAIKILQRHVYYHK